MKYFSRLYVPLIIIVFTFSGCEDTFETTLEINPPEHTDRLVVHAYGSTNGEDLKVHLTQSSGLLESLQNNLISKATALPKPSHLSHAPAGLLNEKIRGSISSIVKPLSGQEKLEE